jgi:hypothetical protein
MHKSGEIGKYFQSFKEKQSKKKNLIEVYISVTKTTFISTLNMSFQWQINSSLIANVRFS